MMKLGRCRVLLIVEKLIEFPLLLGVARENKRQRFQFLVLGNRSSEIVPIGSRRNMVRNRAHLC